jgi:PAS domain S-box-containing protein
MTDVLRDERPLSDARLRQLFDANVIGIVITDNRGAFIEANDAFLRMIGYTRAELDAGTFDWRTLTPPEWLPLDERAIGELATTGAFTQFEKEYIRKDGSRVAITLGGARIDGTADQQICYIVDISAIRQAEAALHESEALQYDAMQRLQESELRYRILAEAMPQLVMVSDGERQIRYVNRYYEEYTGIPSAEIVDRWSEAIHPDDLSAVAAARATGRAYEIEYRLRRASDGAYRWHYARAQPIPDGGPSHGWLATAIDIDDRRRAEEALQFIERAGSLLTQSLDLKTTFETLFDLVVPSYGDWAIVTMRSEAGEVRAIAARHRDPEKQRFAASLCGHQFFRPNSAALLLAVYATGEPRIGNGISRDDIIRGVTAPVAAAIEEMGFGSFIALPIVADGEAIGSIGIASAGDGRRYTPADLPPLEELARRASVAIANARRYEREHRVAESLQAAALPRRLPSLPGLRFDAFYLAGRSEANIGGDWYDAFVLADGRIAISVGDVAGNGLEAAVTMGNVRQMIRTAAHAYADPTLILEVVDETLRSDGDETLATAFVGFIDPVRRTLRCASAGHLPPLLRLSDGTIAEIAAAGAPLGCRNLAPGESKMVALPAGAVLLLYTDGLVEWNRDLLAGEAELRRIVSEGQVFAGPHPARHLVETILPPEGPRDDVAVLAVSFDAAATTRAGT